MWGNIAIAFLLAFITAFVFTPNTIKLAKKIGGMDIPKDDRREHTKPMPKLGGIAVILGFLVSSAYLIISLSIEEMINLNGNEQYGIKMIGLFLGILIIGLTRVYR